MMLVAIAFNFVIERYVEHSVLILVLHEAGNSVRLLQKLFLKNDLRGRGECIRTSNDTLPRVALFEISVVLL